MRQRGGPLLRLLFLVLLAGGLVLWLRLRKPRELKVVLDLTRALPGEVVEVDVTVRRDGHALGRADQIYGTRGAPGSVEITVHAAPGEADVEATLVRLSGSRRTLAHVRLDEAVPAVVRAE